MPERLRYFTMGNALVVPLVKAMGRRITALAEIDQSS
jgi:DNA (cytosine-5)-methyltransferase 1